tara:strand:- start:13395 stop:15893 length:2499 start_codon:yes stop_codon:yes gene_type:complete
MSADDVINAFNQMQSPVGQRTPPLVQQTIKPTTEVEAAFKQIQETGSYTPPPVDGSKPMSQMLEERGVMVGPQPQQEGPQPLVKWSSTPEQLERAKKIEEMVKSMTSEEFEKVFIEKMDTMDTGFAGKLKPVMDFLYGEKAEDASYRQSFNRGFSQELAETGIGVKQRVRDLFGSGSEEEKAAEWLDQRVLRQLDKKTKNPITQAVGKGAGVVAEIAPLAAGAALAAPAAGVGVGTAALLTEGAIYGATRPQKEGYTGADVAKTTAKEAVLSLVGGKASQYIIDAASPLIKTAFSKLTGKAPSGSLINENGLPSEELKQVLEAQGITYGDMLQQSGVFEEMQTLLKAAPAGVDPEQAVRAARYDALDIEPTTSSVTQGFNEAVESQTLRRQINDPEAAALRDALGTESEGFKQALVNLAEETGETSTTGAGQATRDALTARKADVRTEKNEAYKLLAEEAEKVGESLPVSVDTISSAWNQTKKIKRSQMTALHSDLKETLMRYGVIEPDEAFLKLIVSGDEEIGQLSAKNFESMRQELNANINPQDPTTSAIIKPILKELDASVDAAAEGAGQAAKLTDLSKAARTKAKEFAQEFNSKTTVSDLLKTKPGTFDTYSTKAQDVFNKLIKTSRKTPTLQQLDEVMTSLEKSGEKGVKAIADLQSVAIMNLLNEATSQMSAKGVKGQQFSYTAFRKALDGMGEAELKRLFSNNDVALNKLTELGKAAKDSQTFFDAIPKGSANDIQNIFTRAFGPMFSGIGFLKGGGIGKMAAEALTEKAGDTLTKRKLRKAIAAEITGNPQIRVELTKLSKQYPWLFESLGIALTTKSVEANEE